MQLAASGTWKLTDDVNRYLPTDAQLDRGFGRDVTIADLLTHTGGLEEKFSGGIAQMSERVSLAEYFARNRHRRVHEPGVEVSYSNVGMALIGYAVEAASKQSFDRYAATHIFAPLGMTRSTFVQPTPVAWEADIASAPPSGARDIVFLPYPAASLVTTPSDMGRFIAAHLAHSTAIPPAEWMHAMHETHWRAQPSVPGVAYGFFEGEWNGRRTLFHTGDSGDHSVVFLARAPDVFAGDSGEVIAFRRDSNHAVLGFTLSGSIWDPQSFDRISPLEDGRLHMAAFALVALTFVSRLLVIPVAAIGRRVRQHPKSAYSAQERMWWRWSAVIGALALATPIIGLVAAFLSFQPGAVAIPRAALVVGIWLTLVSLGGLPLLPAAAHAWRRHFWAPPRRILFTVVAMGILIGVPLLAYWKLLPFLGG